MYFYKKSKMVFFVDFLVDIDMKSCKIVPLENMFILIPKSDISKILNVENDEKQLLKEKNMLQKMMI